MKSPLLSTRLAAAIFLFFFVCNISAQTVVFSEDFSGFTTGTHSSPSTYDASGTLDTKTGIPGWTGYKVYSAGGEIKLGTSDIPGWIETPEIDFSGIQGDLFLEFDISRWPEDATSVRVLMNGNQIGSTLTPGNESETVEIPITDEVTSGKIKFESLEKRFYLDNIKVIVLTATKNLSFDLDYNDVKIFPNPADNILTIANISAFNRCEIFSFYGTEVIAKELKRSETLIIDVKDLPSGIYYIRLSSSAGIVRKSFIKI